MACISTATVSVLVNSKPTKETRMGRGLKQGCPFSPLLFNLVVEVFSSMMCKATAIHLEKGVEVGRNGINVTQL